MSKQKGIGTFEGILFLLVVVLSVLALGSAIIKHVVAP